MSAKMFATEGSMTIDEFNQFSYYKKLSELKEIISALAKLDHNQFLEQAKELDRDTVQDLLKLDKKKLKKTKRVREVDDDERASKRLREDKETISYFVSYRLKAPYVL